MKLLYRIDEVAEMLGVSRRTVYNLLAEGKLIAHNDKPGKNGIRVTAASVEEYLKCYELPADYFVKGKLEEPKFRRRVLSKGVE